jgi:hypothetical protein
MENRIYTDGFKIENYPPANERSYSQHLDVFNAMTDPTTRDEYYTLYSAIMFPPT